MAFGDLSQFLPSAEGDKLNVAQAKTEAAKRASYLSNMDQFYASLEETQRQFDIQQGFAVEQFEWMSGFEEKKFEEEHELSTERFALEAELGRGGLELQEQIAENEKQYREEMIGIEGERLELEGRKVDLGAQEQDYLQWLYGEKLEMEKGKFGLESEILRQELDPPKPYYSRPIGDAIVSIDHTPWTDPYGTTTYKPRYSDYSYEPLN